MARKLFKTFTINDANRLKTVVSAFNKKRNRAEKTIGNQPTKILYSEITKDITSRAEYNRVINVYSRYLKPGKEKTYNNNSGTVVTRWLRDESRYAITRINNAREKKLKEFGGNITPEAIDNYNLNPRTNHVNTITSEAYLNNKYFKSLQRQANVDYFKQGEERYKNNYIKAIRKEFSGIEGYKELISIIRNASGHDLLAGAASDPTLLIETIYGFEEATLKLEYLIDEWRDYLGLEDDNS